MIVGAFVVSLLLPRLPGIHCVPLNFDGVDGFPWIPHVAGAHVVEQRETVVHPEHEFAGGVHVFHRDIAGIRHVGRVDAQVVLGVLRPCGMHPALDRDGTDGFSAACMGQVRDASGGEVHRRQAVRRGGRDPSSLQSVDGRVLQGDYAADSDMRAAVRPSHRAVRRDDGDTADDGE